MVPPVPINEAAALNDPIFAGKWRAAKAKELDQFDRFGAYEEVDRTTVPLGTQILPTHYIRNVKTDGRFRFKCRLVVAGNHQLGETSYSPTGTNGTETCHGRVCIPWIPYTSGRRVGRVLTVSH